MWTPMAAIFASVLDVGGLARLPGRSGPGEVHTPVRPADSFGRDAEVGAGADQDFLKPAHVIDCAQSLTFAVRRGNAPQIENGITDELARAVESDVAAAITFENLDAALSQDFGRGKDVVPLAIATESDDRRMFEQKKNVADAVFFAQIDQALLQPQAGGVIERAELED